MSDNDFNFDFELESILAEFASDSSSKPETPEQRIPDSSSRRPETDINIRNASVTAANDKPAEAAAVPAASRIYRAGQAQEYVPAAVRQPVRQEAAEVRAPSSEAPMRPRKVEVASDVSAEDRDYYRQARRNYVNQNESAAPRPVPERNADSDEVRRPRSLRREIPENTVVPRREKKPEKSTMPTKEAVSSKKSGFSPVIRAICIVLSLVCALSAACLIRPAAGSASAAASITDGNYNIASAVNSYAHRFAPAEISAEGEEQPAAVKTRFIIPETATVAPAPLAEGFGKIPVTEADSVMDIIQQARNTGLLEEDETMVFDPSAEFNTGSYYEDIQYYIDDTILVICWKEIIDGNTCTFCEVKVQDASQFRRKLAGDMFGSDTLEYTVNMHAQTNAVVSMNADYYRFREYGIVVYNRQLFRMDQSNYLTRNGVLLQKYNCIDSMFVDENGDFLFYHTYDQTTPEDLQAFVDENNILFSLAFGPILVENGQLNSSPDFVEQWYPCGEVNQGYSRAGIGQVGHLHYLYMSLNHSDEKQARWTVYEFGTHFAEQGVINAYCLDGGQTSEIVFQGGIAYNHVDHVNGTSSRQVSDMLFFASAINGEEVES